MRALALTTVAVLISVYQASAQNTSIGTAQNLVAGQAVEVTIDANRTARYYTFRAVAGRSYCAETAPGTTETNTTADTLLQVYRANQVTILAENNDALDEPITGMMQPGGLSRACWIQPASLSEPYNGEATYIAINQYPWASATYRLRLIETTLFSNWFFVGSDYSAFTLLRNTTNTTVPYTLTWRNGSGAAVATASGTLSGNAGTYMDARDKVDELTVPNGTVEVAYTGSPGAITASTTVLSVTTGLSFDAPFTIRMPW